MWSTLGEYSLHKKDAEFSRIGPNAELPLVVDLHRVEVRDTRDEARRREGREADEHL